MSALKSQVPGSMLTGGNILLLECFVSWSNASKTNIVNFVCLWESLLYVIRKLFCTSTIYIKELHLNFSNIQVTVARDKVVVRYANFVFLVM